MFDPKLIAARWYFGEFMHEDLPSIAMDALRHEIDGPRLRRLAGLIKPNSGDISGQEVDAVFREMGVAAPLSLKKRNSSLLLRLRGQSLPAVKTRLTLPLIYRSTSAVSTGRLQNSQQL